MNCPYPGCGGEIPANTQGHCVHCHQRLFICPDCGQPARALARYCTKCGSRLPDREAWGQVRGGHRQTGYVAMEFPWPESGEEWRPHKSLRLGRPRPAALVGGFGYVFIAAGEEGVRVWDPILGEVAATCLTGDGTSVQQAPAVSGRTLVACADKGRQTDRGRVAWFDLQAVIGGASDRAVVTATVDYDLDPGDEPVHPPVLIHGPGGKPLVLVATRRALLALTEGQLLWRRPLQSSVALPAVADGRVWELSAETLVDIDLQTGQEGQPVPLREPANPDAGVIADDGFVYFMTQTGRLMYLQQGRIRRPVPVAATEFPGVTGHGWDGRNHWISTLMGLFSIGFGDHVDWTARDNDVQTLPVLLNGTALAGGMDESDHGVIFVHHSAVGSNKPYTLFVSDQPVASGPVLVDGAIICCTNRGQVVSLVRKPATESGQEG
ncbi:MAG TPA: hypothetical protein VD902_09520 [Symbiobacteriaceae bacterium]|nr:hypothetical protein [Symbiobacteriaceae bacterium]